MHKLYGDGIHDDHPAIQELIDSGVCEVSLPAPENYYLITKPLVLPSNFRLVLPRFAEIRLADGANCVMLRNKWRSIVREDPIIYEGRDQIWNFVNRISPDPADTCENIEVLGGIWNFNNKNQMPNPLHTKEFGPNADYTGFGFQFFNVKNLKISSLTLKDPITFAVTIDIASYFTVEDIIFDFNYGNPIALNMDGIHLDGHCHHGMIRNLKGACYDDLVALNAYEGYAGPITDIVIDGLYAEDCHSAVRLLAIHEEMKNIHITNVFGTYYQYCIGISKFYRVDPTNGFDAITIDNVYASKAIRYADRYPYANAPRIYPLIWIQDGVIVKNLDIRSVHRREKNVPIELLYIGNCFKPIERITVSDMTAENETDKPIPMIVNAGHVKHLRLYGLDADRDEAFVNNGTVDELIQN